ncbi:hypothetical protein [Archangium violaceum]|uniref:Uncharacterized protein n=1 Tax=Archangium violaceum Cb vi76 TaxID=1406225 RepID=A0A084SUQ0_9BACT|nr:hypothetical protein [Archangium violaceum]KFA92185.1 hypothetical protein Q664_18030 [Archangium violaceum Cb vi76]
MHAEAWAPRWAALLGAVLLSTGCVTLAPRQGGSTSEGSRAFPALRETVTIASPLEAPSPLASTELGEHALSAETGTQQRLHRRRSARGLGREAALASSGEAPASEESSAGPSPREPPSCGGQAVPPGWPDFSSSRDELLAPFLTCTSPGEVLALQERVDMPRLVEALDDWRAVRLGGLGPPREDVAHLLNQKRASLLQKAPGAYGRLNAQVLSVYVVDSAYDNDVREILFLLAQERRLEEVLERLPALQAALEKRGLKPTARVERGSTLAQWGRGIRGLGEDTLSSSPAAMDGQDFAFLPIRGQLPPEYQEALEKAEKELVLNASADDMAVSAFDHVTFGVPLGGYHFIATSGHGVWLLWNGEIEEGTREAAPALVLALVGGYKGVRYLAKGEGAAGMRLRLRTGAEAAEARLRALTETARQLQGVMNLQGLRDLAGYIRESREAGRFVAVGGADAALALYEARGSVAKARPLMSKARPGATGSPLATSGAGAGEAATAADDAARSPHGKAPVARGQGTLASLVDEGVGHTREVVEAKLAAAELEATGPRLPKDVKVLEQHRPSLEAPPPEAQGSPRWREYVDYYNKRFKEVESGTAAEGPLKWAPYEQLRGWFARGMAFERDMVKLLQADALKPRAQRSLLGDFDRPRLEIQVGVRKPGTGLRFADVLVIEEGALGGGPRRVETFSFKSRDLARLQGPALEAQMAADAREALQKYGERLDIRRDSLQSLLPKGGEVEVPRVRLVYEGGELKPLNADRLRAAVAATKDAVPGVEVLFQ